jgi:hypothetical protein
MSNNNTNTNGSDNGNGTVDEQAKAKLVLKKRISLLRKRAACGSSKAKTELEILLAVPKPVNGESGPLEFEIVKVVRSLSMSDASPGAKAESRLVSKLFFEASNEKTVDALIDNYRAPYKMYDRLLGDVAEKAKIPLDLSVHKVTWYSDCGGPSRPGYNMPRFENKDGKCLNFTVKFKHVPAPVESAE